MSNERKGLDFSAQNCTYFYDFIKIFKDEFPLSSWIKILEDIEFTQLIGPEVAELPVNDSGAYVLTIDISRGYKAIIEFEIDRSDKLQPVMGGVMKG